MNAGRFWTTWRWKAAAGVCATILLIWTFWPQISKAQTVAHPLTAWGRWPSYPQVVTNTTKVNASRAVVPWNRLAGRTLLTVGTGGKITIIPASATYVERHVTNGVIDSIIIHWAGGTDYVALEHELGHGLGLPDVVAKKDLDNPSRSYWPETRLYDDPTDPRYTPYRGTMNYEDWKTSRWWGADDRATIHTLLGAA